VKRKEKNQGALARDDFEPKAVSPLRNDNKPSPAESKTGKARRRRLNR